MAVKLLLDELTATDDVGLLHTIFRTEGEVPYVRRRSYRSPQAAAHDYFKYCDGMAAAGYTIKSRLGRAWYYEVCMGDLVVETVEVQWPVTDWQREMKLLESHSKK